MCQCGGNVISELMASATA